MSDGRVKYAYLNYDEIPERLEIGQIDAYDVVFTKDTHEQYFIKDDLTPIRITSKVFCFDSVESAIEQLNESQTTYKGQIVAIADNDVGVYHGYIVNKSGEKFIVSSLADSGTEIDYNSLCHRPIINKRGSLSNPVIIGNLENGIYSVSGEYKLFDELETIFSSSTNHLFLVEKDTSIIYVKDISAKEINIYTLSDGVVSKTNIITKNYLDDNGYITETSFDAKIQALDFITRSDVSEYVKQITTEYLDKNLESILDEKIDEKLNKKIVYAQDSDIEKLFT